MKTKNFLSSNTTNTGKEIESAISHTRNEKTFPTLYTLYLPFLPFFVLNRVNFLYRYFLFGQHEHRSLSFTVAKAFTLFLLM